MNQEEPGQLYQELLDLEKERRRKKRLVIVIEDEEAGEAGTDEDVEFIGSREGNPGNGPREIRPDLKGENPGSPREEGPFQGGEGSQGSQPMIGSYLDIARCYERFLCPDASQGGRPEEP
eukprot:11537433-Heterocapsa_arctica.AAC.1